jgi:hypothetical protein
MNPFKEEFLEILSNYQGILQGAPIGLFVAFLGVTKIRKYQMINLEFLKDLYGRL